MLNLQNSPFVSFFPLLQYLVKGDYLSAFAFFTSCIIIVFLVSPFHELAHAWASNKLGDPTARYAGRLSMNPMRHIDWLGAALIMAVGWGWAKPVPVNTRYFQHPKRDMALTALAGPISNLLMALAALLLRNGVLAIANGVTLSHGFVIQLLGFLYLLFFYIALINVGLAVFNLIPIPPLDGSRLLTALLPNHLYYKIMAYERYIMLGLLALIFFGVLDGPLSFLRNGAMNGLEFLADLPFRWLT